ncbi:MAG: Bax inhibitor-1 family protein [Akkermansiaceae bacterium]|nr:Bax inhibitor-1 family protein [Akkermansiaceae bacterium]
MSDTFYQETMTVARASGDARAAFIRRTYGHLAGAVIAFLLVVSALLHYTTLPQAMLGFIQANQFGWLMLLGGFMLIGWMARGLAAGAGGTAVQYAGLGLYVVAQALLFLPLLYIATVFASPDVLPQAAICTGALFGGLTFVVFTTRKDFSFLGSILKVGGLIALGAIVAGAIFGFNLGLGFTVLMIVFASAAILYDTSRIMREYPTDRHVGASLELFASVALLFWYVLQLFMARD